MRYARWFVWTSWAVLASCSDPDDRLSPTVTQVIDGVEIATVGELSDPFDPDYTWELRVVREVRTVLPGRDEPLVFDAVRALPLGNGNLLVADMMADEPLVLLDPESESVVRRFGTKGEGPGELGGAWPLMAEAEDGTLLVLDVRNRQVHAFTAEGAWSGSQRIEGDGRVVEAALAFGGTTFLTGVQDSGESWMRRRLDVLDPTTGVATPLLHLPRPAGPDADIFQRGRVLWTALGSDVVGLWAYEPVVGVYGRDGNRHREIRLPMTRRVVTEEDIGDQRARHGAIANGLRAGPMGLTNALWAVNDTVFAMLLSTLWRADEDPPIPPGTLLWRLFTVDGHYVGVVEPPEGYRHLGLGNGTMWLRVLNERSEPVIQEVVLARAESGG